MKIFPNIKLNREFFTKRLHTKYHLLILDKETLEEKISFQLTRMNVYIVASTIFVVLFGLIFSLLTFTPLREYIPGYADVGMRKDILQLNSTADSLSEVIQMQNQFINNLQMVLNGEDMDSVQLQMLAQDMDQEETAKSKKVAHKDVQLSHKTSKDDSILRDKMEKEEIYAITQQQGVSPASLMKQLSWTPPVEGLVTNTYNIGGNHWGIDMVAKEKEPIRAVADGRVIFSAWTLDTGNVIAIQHDSNWITFYKHNSELLKKSGATVKAGDAIAIIGNSGELSSGPHLHFEMWHNGKPQNPAEYFNF